MVVFEKGKKGRWGREREKREEEPKPKQNKIKQKNSRQYNVLNSYVSTFYFLDKPFRNKKLNNLSTPWFHIVWITRAEATC